MAKLTVREEAEMLGEDNRQVRVYKIEIPAPKENCSHNHTISSSFSTGLIPWSYEFITEKPGNIHGRNDGWKLFLKLVPGGSHIPFVHLSLSTCYTKSSGEIIYVTSASSPGENFMAIDSNGLYINLPSPGNVFYGVAHYSFIQRISGCLRVDMSLIEVNDKRRKRFNKVGMKLLNTWLSGAFCDMTIKVGEKTFPAHRFVLSAQSPVFLAMLTQPMKESTDGLVEIKDSKPEAIEILLNYLYSGSMPDTSDEIFPQVLYLAHKYQIDELMEVCELRLLDLLKSDVAVEALKLADLYGLKCLKDRVVRFIGLRRYEIFDTQAWEELQQTKPKLVIQVLMFCIPR